VFKISKEKPQADQDLRFFREDEGYSNSINIEYLSYCNAISMP